MQSPAAFPVPAGDRLDLLDALRGFALLGILLANVLARAGALGDTLNPTAIVDDLASTIRAELDFLLIDTASGSAVWCKMGHFQTIVTHDLRLDYLRPAVEGETVVARCQCYKLTRSIGFVRGVAHGGDPERPIAHSAATFMLNP